MKYIEDSIDMALPRALLTSSICFFMMGLLFAIGQTGYLGLEYLNTFGYVDFIRNTAIALPLLIGGVFLLGILNFLLNFINIFRILYLAIKEDTKSNTWKFFSVISCLIPIILILSAFGYFVFLPLFQENETPIYLTLLFFAIWFPVALIGISMSKYREYYLTKMQTEKSTSQKKKIPLLSIMGFGLFLSPIFGLASIHVQDQERPDAKIEFLDKEVLDVNILASNFNVIAIYSDGEVQIINRSYLKRIRRVKELP